MDDGIHAGEGECYNKSTEKLQKTMNIRTEQEDDFQVLGGWGAGPGGR